MFQQMTRANQRLKTQLPAAQLLTQDFLLRLGPAETIKHPAGGRADMNGENQNGGQKKYHKYHSWPARHGHKGYRLGIFNFILTCK